MSAVQNSGETIALDAETQTAFEALHKFMFDHVYFNPLCKSEESKAIDMVIWLYQYFILNAGSLPEDYRRICNAEGPERAAVDYIAGMTDRFAIHTFEACFVPKGWGIF